MNIIINQNKLLTALRSVEHIVSKNVSLPILTSILLKTEGSQLKLTATNLEMGIQYWISAKIEKEGVIAIPARIFSEFISTIKDEKVHMIGDKNILSISSEHYKTQILGMKSDEFPLIPSIKNTQELTIGGEQLRNALMNVVDATALIETRPELNGVYIQLSPKMMTCAATDSFRLAEYSSPIGGGFEKSFILPRTTALEIIKLTSGRTEEVKISLSDNQISVRGADYELVSRLIDGRYPEYKKVIPERFSTTLTIPKSELERTVRMASIFSSSIADLQLKATSTSLQLMAKNSDKGEIISSIPLDHNKESFSVSLNYRYLLDGLKNISTENVVIGYTGEGSPLVVQGENTKNHIYVIMPLRA